VVTCKIKKVLQKISAFYFNVTMFEKEITKVFTARGFKTLAKLI